MNICKTMTVLGEQGNETQSCHIVDMAITTTTEQGSFPRDPTEFLAHLSTTLTVVLVLYMLIAVLFNLVFWCQFFFTWNFIMKTHRISTDSSCGVTRRSLWSSLVSRCVGARGTASSSSSTSTLCSNAILQDECPICLIGFADEGSSGVRNFDYIISCPCKKNFHHECLAMWLERGSNCPCCRRDLVGNSRHHHHHLHQQQRSWMADLSIFVGFPPR